MGIKELNEGFEIIKNSIDADFEGNKDESLILKAENFLGVRFPLTYRLFLLELGCGDIEGKEFYGIINDTFKNSSIPNAIWLTQDLRDNLNAPDFLIFISESEEGYFALDLSQLTNEKDAPIIDWNSSKEEPFEILYSDFGTFLLSMLT